MLDRCCVCFVFYRSWVLFVLITSGSLKLSCDILPLFPPDPRCQHAQLQHQGEMFRHMLRWRHPVFNTRECLWLCCSKGVLYVLSDVMLSLGIPSRLLLLLGMFQVIFFFFSSFSFAVFLFIGTNKTFKIPCLSANTIRTTSYALLHARRFWRWRNVICTLLNRSLAVSEELPLSVHTGQSLVAVLKGNLFTGFSSW